jgi:hypothetical protein
MVCVWDLGMEFLVHSIKMFCRDCSWIVLPLTLASASSVTGGVFFVKALIKRCSLEPDEKNEVHQLAIPFMGYHFLILILLVTYTIPSLIASMSAGGSISGTSSGFINLILY